MAEDVTSIQSQFQLLIPVNGKVTSHFGNRENENDNVSPYHTGTDIAANTGTEIYAAHSGEVILAREYYSYGNCVMIENGDLITLYAHCSTINVAENQNVNEGDVIAKVGMTGNATGSHLHFEIHYQDRLIDPEKILTWQ